MVALEKEPPPVASSPPASAEAIPLSLRRHGGSPRQVLALTVIGTLVLGMFASRDLSTWLGRMGGGPILEMLQNAAAEWDVAMESIDLTRPHDAIRAAMRRLLDRRWGEPPP